MLQNKGEKAWGWSRKAAAIECPSNTLVLTESRMLLAWGLEVCSDTAVRTSAIGSPALNKVASCRVIRVNSLLDKARCHKKFLNEKFLQEKEGEALKLKVFFLLA